MMQTAVARQAFRKGQEGVKGKTVRQANAGINRIYPKTINCQLSTVNYQLIKNNIPWSKQLNKQQQWKHC